MGWLKDLGRWIGEKVENFGEFIGSETISNFGRNIQDACSEKISREVSYDKREANIHTTERLNEILVSFSEGYLHGCDAIENSAIREVERYYDYLIDLVEQAPEKVSRPANIKALKNAKSRIAINIRGGVKEPLAKRMSIDDSECLKILKMDAGSGKRKAMNQFSDKVIREALQNLSRRIREEMDAHLEEIRLYFLDVSEAQESFMKQMQEHINKMLDNVDRKQGSIDQQCVIPLYISETSDRVCEILR